MATRIGRNEPCPCGSGDKYKKCCGVGAADREEPVMRYGRFVLAGLIALGAVGIGSYLVADDVAGEAGALAEPNRVWSSEHGHWHVAGAGDDASAAAPQGKVWSPEHGHWHDAPPLARSKVDNNAFEDRLAGEFEKAERAGAAPEAELPVEPTDETTDAAASEPEGE